jgi:transcriptional activator of cad operon
MMARSGPPEIRRMDRLSVGGWLVEPALNQLTRGAAVERLEPKAVEVLLAPARHAGQVMSRDQLIAEVWNGIAVSDDALTQSIIKLRKALGDTTREPAYIQTIPKRGYRLIARCCRRASASPHGAAGRSRATRWSRSR